MSISVPLIFDKDVETFGSFQNLSNIINAVNTELEDNYDSNAAETVSRTIYVETTGDDITGDGTLGLPYLTIGKALSSIKKTINSGVTITVNVGIGTFTISANDLIVLSSISGAGTLEIIGTLVLIDSGFTMGAPEALDPLTYAVSGGNTASWTNDQWKFTFLKSGSSYIPITENTNSVISIVYPATGTEIYESQTNITLSYTASYIFNISTNLSFLNCNLFFTNNNLRFLTSSNGTIKFAICKLESSTTTNRTILLGDDGRTCAWYIFSCVLKNVPAGIYNQSYQATGRIFSSVNSTYNMLLASGNEKISYSVYFNSIVFENLNLTTGTCIIIQRGYLQFLISLTTNEYIKFQNSRICMRQGISSNINLGMPTFGFIILKDVDYYLVKVAGNSDFTFLTFNTPYSNIKGTPNIRWFFDPMYEFVNLSSGRNIQIQNLIYPEYSTDSSIALINNTITDISIGHTLQNKSIKIDYTLSRNVRGFRQGSFNILSDGSTLYMSPDVSTSFITSNVNYVDGNAIAFSAIRDASIIKLRATVDASGGNVSLAYNATRVMKTPIIL